MKPSWLPDRLQGDGSTRNMIKSMATRHFRTLVVLAITFSILSLSYLSLHTSSSIHDWESPTTAKESNLDDKATFVKAILENEFDSEFDPAPIKKVCDRTQWHAGLIFTCTPPQGGIGNVRNVFLNCIRYAMEAGGHFVVPEIVTRDETDLSNLTTASTAPFTYMFNETYFKYSMSKACPKMKILNKLPDGYTTIKLTAADLTPETYFGRVITHMDQWRPAFDNWLKTNRGSHQFINAALGTPLLNFPIHYDSEDFIYNFGRILQTRRQAQVMAANVLYNMRTKHEIGIQPIGIQTNAYLGAHLRTAADAKKAGWLSYAEQSAFYFVYAASRGLKTIYVTSESEPAATFKSDGEILGMKVLTKEDLLDEPERKELKTMTWDQMALVDYEVLLRAKAFGGIDTSSFSWNIAQRRHGMVSSGVEGWREGEGLNVKDGISSLLGEKWRHEMFREAMWP